MSLEIESRIIATGVVAFVVPGTPAWAAAPARHPGFEAAIIDGGVGIYTVTLSGDVPAGGAIARGSVVGANPGFVQQAAAVPNTRALQILVCDDAGNPADLPFTITVEAMPFQA